MPTYRYRCGGCGKEFEVWQSITDDPLRTHDDGCGGELVKVLTPAGIVLKGSGFYRNDSRSSNNGSLTGGAKDKSESSSKDKTESSAKSDSSSSDKSSAKSDSSSSSSSKDSGSSSSSSKSGSTSEKVA